MPTDGNYSISDCMSKSNQRKATIKYWMNKGCSEGKAETLFYRYGYKKVQ